VEDAFVHDLFFRLLRTPYFDLSYYEVTMVLGFFAGALLWRWQMRRGGYSKRFFWLMLVFSHVLMFLGLRLFHCALWSPQYFYSKPERILEFAKGGYASHGALFALAFFFWFLARRYKKSFLDLFDRFSFYVAPAWAFIRIGNFAQTEIVGRETTLPWGVRFMRYNDEGSVIRHPTQIYEALLLALSLGVILWADRRFGRENRPPGLIFGLWLSVYFTGRFFLEFIKELDLTLSVFTMGHLLSVPCMLIGYYLVRRGLTGEKK
jgi:phosphatidylglycerol:prolipoprotein diacylglycerol transferase